MRPLLPHEGPRHAGVGTGVSITMEPIGGGSSSWAVASMLPLRKRAIATNTRSRIREDMVLGKYREEGRGVKRGGAASPLVDGTMPSKCSAGCVRRPGGGGREPRGGGRGRAPGGRGAGAGAAGPPPRRHGCRLREQSRRSWRTGDRIRVRRSTRKGGWPGNGACTSREPLERPKPARLLSGSGRRDRSTRALGKDASAKAFCGQGHFSLVYDCTLVFGVLAMSMAVVG